MHQEDEDQNQDSGSSESGKWRCGLEAYPGFLTAPKAGKQTGLIKRQDLQEEGGNLKVIYFILLSLNAKSLPVNC